MLNAWTKRLDVDVDFLQGTFECVEHDAIRAITDRVDILNMEGLVYTETRN